MLRIFHQSKTNYDSSVRVAALEFILDNHPSQQVIRDVLLSCLDQSNAEFSTYIIRLLFDAASTNSEIRYLGEHHLNIILSYDVLILFIYDFLILFMGWYG